MKSYAFHISCLVFLLASCNQGNKESQTLKVMDVQGHRGCRGLLPENSIPAFIKAMELGVTTLEMDVVITKDEKVIISHEPFFNHEISIGPDNLEITEVNERDHNIYQMTYEESKAYDVGLKSHPRFLTQEKIAVTKPLFSELVTEIKNWCASNNKELPYFNVEIKRKEGSDGIFHPDANRFAALLIQDIKDLGIMDKTYIQSFDIASLQSVKSQESNIKLVLLIENLDGPEKNIEKLGFNPEVYSPYFSLVNDTLVSYCKNNNIQLIPWTANDIEQFEALIELDVTGIITDYPDKLIQLLESKNIQIKH